MIRPASRRRRPRRVGIPCERGSVRTETASPPSTKPADVRELADRPARTIRAASREPCPRSPGWPAASPASGVALARLPAYDRSRMRSSRSRSEACRMTRRPFRTSRTSLSTRRGEGRAKPLEPNRHAPPVVHPSSVHSGGTTRSWRGRTTSVTRWSAWIACASHRSTSS
jgi:hypothetical protein